MNIFVYDESLKNSPKQIKTIENNLNNLGLNGKIIYCSPGFDHLLQTEIINGAHTIISVGNNLTIHKTINAAIKTNEIKENISFGIIPIGKNNSFAEQLGIKDDKSACQIILARRLEKIDIALAGKEYFIESAKIKTKGTFIKTGGYQLEALEDGYISFYNLNCSTKNKNADPQDGFLEIIINSKTKNNNFLKINKAQIENLFNHPLLLDGSVEIAAPADIEVLKQKILFIVGKNRCFGSL